MTGILAGLAILDQRIIDIGDTRFDQAMADAYEVLVSHQNDYDLEIAFQIIPDKMHGDSIVVQDAITVAIESRLAGRVNPTFRRIQITIDRPWAESLISKLPGSPELYSSLAKCFLASYRGGSVPAI